MRAFVLGTGRCGTVTLSKALSHATNYTVGHESRAHLLEGRLDYPDNHIEVDGRLSWFVGSLLRRYPDALYVHLKRNTQDTVESVAWRKPRASSMLAAFGHGVVMTPKPQFDRYKAAQLVVDTIQDNVDLIYKVNPFGFMWIELERIQKGFEDLWGRLWIEGDQDAALAELKVHHNARKG